MESQWKMGGERAQTMAQGVHIILFYYYNSTNNYLKLDFMYSHHHHHFTRDRPPLNSPPVKTLSTVVF
jgi:hypothetical protein